MNTRTASLPFAWSCLAICAVLSALGCLRAEPGKLVVVGGGAVIVIDARKAKSLGEGKGEDDADGEEQSWQGIQLQWLRAGAEFAF